MYNPLIQLNHQKNDILESLRGEIGFWLSQPNRSQKLLSTRAGLAPQVLNDILQRRRGCGPETYEKIVKAIRSNGARFENVQVFGQAVEDQPIDITAFQAEHTAAHLNRIQNSGKNLNAGTTFADKKEFSNE